MSRNRIQRRVFPFALALAACGPSVKNTQDTAGLSGSNSAADSMTNDSNGDSDGEPLVDQTTPYGSFPNCLQISTAARESDYCAGWVIQGYDPEQGCVQCACWTMCENDSDCLPAEGASAQPRCDEGTCVLDCTDASDCPEAMACTNLGVSPEIGRVCAWRTSDPFYCEALFGDPCADLTAEACEQPGSPLLPNHGCKWVTEYIYEAPSATCEPLTSEQRCIGVVQTEGEECAAQSQAQCGDSDTSVFWQDVGAGTARMLTLDRCERPAFMDLTEDRMYVPCDYDGNLASPLLCDCQCAP